MFANDHEPDYLQNVPLARSEICATAIHCIHRLPVVMKQATTTANGFSGEIVFPERGNLLNRSLNAETSAGWRNEDSAEKPKWVT